MSQTTQAISPLRQRMIEDMRMRKLCDKTQASYIRAVRQFAGYSWADRPTAPALRTCAAFSCTWWITGSRRSRSMRPSPG